MAQFSAMELTNTGLTMQAACTAGNKLIITKVQLGDGVVTESITPTELTELINYVADTQIVSNAVASGNVVKVVARLSSGQTAFYLREIGVFAKVETTDGTVIHSEGLYAYAYTATGDYIPAAGGTTSVVQDINLAIIVANSAAVTVNVTGEIGTTTAEFTAHKTAGVIDHPDGSVTWGKLANDVQRKINTGGISVTDVTLSAYTDNSDSITTTADVTLLTDNSKYYRIIDSCDLIGHFADAAGSLFSECYISNVDLVSVLGVSEMPGAGLEIVVTTLNNGEKLLHYDGSSWVLVSPAIIKRVEALENSVGAANAVLQQLITTGV